MSQTKSSSSKKQLEVWSASPTPFTKDWEIDLASTERMMERHTALACDGIMLGGTCGEGPWLRQRDLEKLVSCAVKHSGDKIKIAVQTTDNSESLILERIEAIEKWGAKYAIIAQPFLLMNATPSRLRRFYLDIFERSPLPVFFYDRGKHSSVSVPSEILPDILAHPRVVGIKNSSGDDSRYKLMSAARTKRPELRIFQGDEFSLVPSLQSGYDGAFFGGMILSAKAVRETMRLFQNGQLDEAIALDQLTQKLLLDAYGGKTIACWLSGLKYLLVKLGVFSEWNNIPDYPLEPFCQEAIDKAISDCKWLHA